MPIGEFTKYGLVFSSSLIGAVSGYFYSSKPFNLRMRLERKGSRLLRPSDELWMYKRILKQKKATLKEMEEVKTTEPYKNSQVQASGAQQQQQKEPKTDLQKLKEFAEGTPTEPTDEQAIALLNWCQEKLTNAKYNSWSWEKDVTTFCEFPKWSQ